MDKKPSYELSQEELAYIAQYLNDELEHEHREVFELQLKHDEEFRQKVAEVKALLIGVRERNLAQQLDAFHQTLEQEVRGSNGGGKTIPYYRQWWVAASAAIIVLSGIWWVWFYTPSPERLYRSYFVPDMGLPVEMSTTDTIRYTFYDGMISYKEGNYADALEKWETLAEDRFASDTLLYYRGVAYMGMGDIDNALSHLATVAADRRSVFYDEATWYLALCYLKLDDQRAATSLLRRIPDDHRATMLLEQME